MRLYPAHCIYGVKEDWTISPVTDGEVDLVASNIFLASINS